MKKSKNTFLIILTLLLSIPMSYSQQTKMASSSEIGEGSINVLVQHNVANYATWKMAYKKDMKRRTKAGIREKLLLRDINNANYITVVFEIENLEIAKVFFLDPYSAKLMEAAGVTSKPNFLYFKTSKATAPIGTSMLFVQHTVKDYDYWKREFDKHHNVRSKYNIALTTLGVNIENPLNVVALFSSVSPDNILDFLNKSDLKEAMKNAGITSKPIQEVLVLDEK
ncbi:MAG: hypothetical protein COA50_16885 [Flavobacteriaceae bacterium]|nr:MAG: hypothetical protein COA50_16885 [Flavobacteriaceae bacterium]